MAYFVYLKAKFATTPTRREAATIAEIYESFVRTAGTAREKVAQGNFLQISTASETNRQRALIQPARKIRL
jgi:hypothetical protein